MAVPTRDHGQVGSRNGTLWNVGPRGWSAYSALMLAARITLPHFFGFLGNELPEVRGRSRKHGATEVGKARL